MRLLFGDCEFDTGRRVLLRHGSSKSLSPKAFQLLEILLDRRPEAVSKTELVERLWPDTFVADAGLHNLMTEVRAALGDDPRAARFIRTIPRYGYAFHGDAQPAPAVDVGHSQPARSGPCVIWRRREWPLAAGSNLVGRDRECAVCIESDTISRRHARIVVTGSEATIEDLESKNGTFVNGQRVKQPVVLEAAAEIRVGSVTLTYRVLDLLPSTLTHGRS